MNNKQIFVRLAVCALTTAMMSCSDTEFDTSNPHGNTTITGEIAQPKQTRTLIDTDTQEDGSTGLLWSVNDSLGIFGSTNNNHLFESTNTSPAATASFTGNLADGETPQYAYYPYNADAGTDPANVAVELLGTQDYSGPASIAKNCIFVGSTPTIGEDGNYKFTFQPVVAMLHVTVNFEGVDGLTTTEHLEEIQIEPYVDTDVEAEAESDETASSTSSDWAGNFTVDLTSATPALVAVDGEASSGLTVSMTEQPAVDGTVEAYACIAPSIKKGERIFVQLFTDEHYITFKVNALQDILAGYCYEIPFTLSAATEDNELTIATRPKIESLSFTAANNSGKILSKKLVYSDSYSTTIGGTTLKGGTRPVTDAASTTYTFTPEGDSIVGCIPYLYDYNLVPTVGFNLDDCTLSYSTDGGETFTAWTAGETIDFSKCTQLCVETADCLARIYDVSITNSGLPVVVINQESTTANATETWTEAGLTVTSKSSIWPTDGTLSVYNADGTINNSIENEACGVRLRGNSSQNYVKKPFAIKFDKKQNPLDIMGEGEKGHKRWVLLANWKDRTLMRNHVCLGLAKQFKKYSKSVTDFPRGLDWTPEGEFVEVVYNGTHIGNYYLCEQIKIAGKRLDIHDPYKTETGTITTDSLANYGYLLECDVNYDEDNKFYSNTCKLPFMFKDDVDAGGVIMNYVKTKVNGIEQNIVNSNWDAVYANFDIYSAVDYWLLMELVMNDEISHPKSVYMYIDGTSASTTKNEKPGMLCTGPVWDFDWASIPNIASGVTQNTGYTDYTSSILSKRTNQTYVWYYYLARNSELFRSTAKSRWAVMKSVMKDYADSKILKKGRKIATSWKYNDEMWPLNSTYGQAKLKEQSGFAGDESLTFEEAYTALYNNLLKRIEGMDSFVGSWK